MPSCNFFKSVKEHPKVASGATILVGLIVVAFGIDFDDGTTSDNERPLVITGSTMAALGFLSCMYFVVKKCASTTGEMEIPLNSNSASEPEVHPSDLPRSLSFHNENKNDQNNLNDPEMASNKTEGSFGDTSPNYS